MGRLRVWTRVKPPENSMEHSRPQASGSCGIMQHPLGTRSYDSVRYQRRTRVQETSRHCTRPFSRFTLLWEAQGFVLDLATNRRRSSRSIGVQKSGPRPAVTGEDGLQIRHFPTPPTVPSLCRSLVDPNHRHALGVPCCYTTKSKSRQ